MTFDEPRAKILRYLYKKENNPELFPMTLTEFGDLLVSRETLTQLQFSAARLWLNNNGYIAAGALTPLARQKIENILTWLRNNAPDPRDAEAMATWNPDSYNEPE